MSSNARSNEDTHFNTDDFVNHIAIVREFMEGTHTDSSRFEKYLSEDCRIFFDTNPGDAVYYGNKCFIGPASLKEVYEEYGDKTLTYEIKILDIFTSGPLVIVSRIDIRREAGKPDLRFPAVGVFAFKGGKIIEWSDYYR